MIHRRRRAWSTDGLPGAALAASLLLLIGCGPVTPRTTFPPAGSTPAAAGDGTALARQEVVAALAAAGLPARDSPAPFRPPEGPLLAGAPRSVVQAILPDDPGHGFVVVYALGSPQAAQSAAADHAAYVASPIGRVQFPASARHVLRVVGPSVVSFTWVPDASPDPRTRSIEDALLQVGSAVPIPA
jgi:hypothetical protein